ncbi:MAG: DUF448 domain-containing protein [Magnetococcales bacterium]|nr:DUF448 domain-containing protein [Magnetococcales bacterium]
MARKSQNSRRTRNEAEDKSPRRTCLVSRQEGPREELLRLVVDPQGRLTEDLGGRLPGRGLWLHPSQENLRVLASRPGQLEKLARHPVILPDMDTWSERLGQGLSRRAVEGIGLARRAGMVRTGLLMAAELLEQGADPLLLLAGDTADNTREKVDRLVRRHGCRQPLELLDRDHLGAACGRGPTALLAVLDGGAARRVRADALRWRAFFIS